ncbi:hemolysin III family protein [Myxococcota bacterium]
MTSEVSPPPQKPYSFGEEVANASSHGIGIALSVSGLTLLVVTGSLFGDGWQLAGAITFGTTLVLLYSASTLYHSIPVSRAKHVFKVLDHCAIYLLIAGTYTPFALVTLRNDNGLWLFAIVWGIAVLGIALEAFVVFRPKWLSASLYIAMGWIAIVMVGPLVRELPTSGLALLVAGGLAYTIGTLFYVAKQVRYMHVVWHGFVLGGSVCHFLAVQLYVIPIKMPVLQ